MSYIRGQERMVYQTTFDLLQAQLTALGWLATDVDTLPFGATTLVTLLETAPDPKLSAIKPNTVAFSEGKTPDDAEGELGAAYGGLWEATHTFFIDVYGESSGIAKAITSDIRAVLTGRLPGTNRYVPMNDYSATPVAAAPGHLLRFDDVEIDRPMATTGMHWEVVKVTAVHQFSAPMGAGQ